jgi:putative acetyltransferase
MDEHLFGGEPYPAVLEPERAVTYPASACAGGGYVWDAVLEYRVWCHPERGASEQEGDDYYHAFRSYEEALEYPQNSPVTEEPLALVLQREYIDEPETGDHRHVRAKRITEWPVEFLRRPRRTEETLPKFFAADAPSNRLDIIRGLSEWPE